MNNKDAEHSAQPRSLISTLVIRYLESTVVKNFIILARIKSGNFGHQVNSDKHSQTRENPDEMALMFFLLKTFSECFYPANIC